MSDNRKKQKNIAFEESLGEDLSRELDVHEVSIGERPLVFAAAAIFLVGLIFAARMLQLNVFSGEFYSARADANQARRDLISAPRGLIYDRNGEVLAENKAVFSAVLSAREFLRKSEQEEIVEEIGIALGISADEIWTRIKESAEDDFVAPIVLKENLTHGELIALESANIPTIFVERNFLRVYPKGQIFSSVVGYVGRVDADDLKRDPSLSLERFTGKSGAELFYDELLRGKPGVIERKRDAKGNVLGEEVKKEPEAGGSLRLTIDGEFQEYFYRRLYDGLAALGRRVGVGLALDPRNGEILAMVNLPGFDGNVFSDYERIGERRAVLNSPYKPLFNRAISGLYAPGSTIKPLHAIAALKEGVVGANRIIFSPGYIDIQNPFDPELFTRYNDWRYQGNVNVRSAIARSSNVYFYIIGGGAPRGVDPQVLAGGGYVSGLGINRLNQWWQKFMLGVKSGIDIHGEADGFLPTPDWKEKRIGRPWLLGDTYNVSIGQGDLLLTPLQLLNYISSIANGGKIYQPRVNLDNPAKNLLADLSELLPEISEVRKGMEEAVTSPMGTAHLLDDLVFKVAAKTGTAEVRSKAGENAFFVGFMPAEDPQLAILVLVENSLEGSLNTVPIAKDALNWYYWNRVAIMEN